MEGEVRGKQNTRGSAARASVFAGCLMSASVARTTKFFVVAALTAVAAAIDLRAEFLDRAGQLLHLLTQGVEFISGRMRRLLHVAPGRG